MAIPNAAKKVRKPRKKNKQLSLKMGLNDERIPKLLGLLLILAALYLFIAFTSYLFTWRGDQDQVMRFSWGLLLQGNVSINNWLGRLGAIVSHQFFYWWFGISSSIFVFLTFITGLSLTLRKPLKSLNKIYRYSVFLIIGLSPFLEFLFGKAKFPWGGAFGEAVNHWLSDFIGVVGMVVFFLFIMAAALIWAFNPNVNKMTWKRTVYELSKALRLDKIAFFKKYIPKPETEGVLENAEVQNSLRPKTELQSNKNFEVNPKVKQGDGFEVVTPPKAKEKLTVDKEGQIALNVGDKKREKPKALQEGEAKLEIEKNTDKQAPLSVQTENKTHLEPYDSTLDLSSYESPILELLESYDDQKVEIDRAELERNKDQIIATLLNYKIEITKIKATIGPTVTLYEIVPVPGVRISKIKSLEDDIALSLAALGIRIIAPIPGKGTIGIEVPNQSNQIVSLREVLDSDKFKNAKMDLPIALGKTISNEVFIADLAKMPHLLVAGATGQGKSVGINAILMSILYKKHPSQVKLVLIDPKKVELSLYTKIENHFLAYLPGEDEPIVTETQKVVHTLHSVTIEMDQRYDLLKKAQVRNLREYNQKFVERRLNPEKGHRFMPYIVVVIDEFADLIMTAGKEVELPIGRLAQLARAVGIHLVIATQRPSVNIITGVIKANFPARLAFKVTSKIDSRTILDQGGADQLIGRGDMLLSVGGDVVRIQCAFVDTPEVDRVINFISKQQGYPIPYFLPEVAAGDDEVGNSGLKYDDFDDLFEDAARLVVQHQQGSTSMIQRRMKLGYNRAGRIMDQLEAVGIVGPSAGSKAREVLIYDEIELQKYLEIMKKK